MAEKEEKKAFKRFKITNYESDREKPFPQRISVRENIETGEKEYHGLGVIIAQSSNPAIPSQQIPATFVMDGVKDINDAFEKFDDQHNAKMEEIRQQMMKQMTGRIIDPSAMGGNPLKNGKLDFGNLGKGN